MIGFCPNCERETTLIRVRKSEALNIRGEVIEVNSEVYQCQECGEEFDDPKSDVDPVEEAYNEYRCRKSMVHPEEIREFRKKYGLTQRELSELLGFGGATFSRYENGALQDEAHDKVLRLIMDPANLHKIIELKPGAVTPEKRKEIILKLQEEERKNTINYLLSQSLSSYEPDIFSGYKKLDKEKLFNVVKHFCFPEGVYKTKLTKLLFYADFFHFNIYSISITGSRYAKLPYGPVPDNFELWFAFLLNEDRQMKKEEVWERDFPGELFISENPPDYSIFSNSELKMLATVKEKFMKLSATQLKNYSHKEIGYKETPNSELIPYSYAESIED